VIVFVRERVDAARHRVEDPVPTASRMITAETPIITPRTVSVERRMLAFHPRASHAECVERAHAGTPREKTRSSPVSAATLGGGLADGDQPAVVDDETVTEPHHPFRVRGYVVLVRDQDERCDRSG